MEIFCRMRIKWYYFIKMFFHLICEVFLAENQKYFNVGKVRKYDEDTIIWKKNVSFF